MHRNKFLNIVEVGQCRQATRLPKGTKRLKKIVK